MQQFTILTINPGSTSTKVAIFKDDTLLFEQSIDHNVKELSTYPTITSQFEFRRQAILDYLKSENFSLESIDIIVGRGGVLAPISSGIYGVNSEMLEDLSSSCYGEHASNLGGLIAYDLASLLGSNVKAYIADPVVVDELEDIARISGHPLFERRSIFHALNQKAIGRAYAKQIDKRYDDLNLIIVHMGGGISIGAHRRGRVIDVNNTLDGDGPFSPERSGTLPVGALIDACYSGKYSHKQMRSFIKGQGGLVGHLGTNDIRSCIAKFKANEPHTTMILSAMCYNVSKSIGSMAAVLCGKVDAILITGGIANNKETLIPLIIERVSFIAPTAIFAGEDEMLALAQNGLMVARKEIVAKEYVR